MEQNISPAKSGLQLGFLFGLIMVLEFVIMYVIGMESLINGPVGLTVNLLNFIVLPFILITIACKNFKKTNGGFISLSQALKVGVTLMFIAGLVYAVFNLIFNFIFPEFVEEMIQIVRTQTIEKNPQLTEKQLDAILSMQRKFMNPAIASPVTVAMYSFFGLIYSLIVGAIVKKEKPQSF